MLNWWRNLSVVKKLYAVFGVMALLIILELLALSFAMTTLSAVRAFVEGEALWSKAQKNAIQSLHLYAMTQDPKSYAEFQHHLKVPMGDHQARLELQKLPPDLTRMRQGFLQGGVHPEDVDNMINLLLRFNRISYIARAIEVWTSGDDLIQELILAAERLHQTIENKEGPQAINQALAEINRLNLELTSLEIEFSKALGEGSRWLEGLLFLILFMAVFTVESTGLLLTFSFSKNLSRSLRELSLAATEVGKGNFDQKVPVRTQDELGQVATALNKMIQDLKTSIGQQRKAEDANQTKTLFLANVSHELRTPLGVILGYIELMKDPHLTEFERKDYLDIIDHTGKNLNRIVNDILDISKVETGHIDLKITTFSLDEFVNDLERMLEHKAHSLQTDLGFKALGEVPTHIATDRDRLHQILVNVINNALKFTRAGKIQVTYWLEGPRLHFEVQDTGIGIPIEHQDRLFKHFSQVDSDYSPNQEGAGLGLALSRGLARMMEGDLVLKESQVHKGSTFKFWINVELPNGASPEKGPRTFQDLSTLKGKKILVVDDAAENQILVSLFLSKEGVQVTTAENGKVAIEFAQKESYDLILMDMQMPVMNGFEATSELRRLGFAKPIVAFTANAMKGDERKCLEVGCNAFLSKPVVRNHLLQTIANLI